jgi:hypothetical protein
VQTDRDYENNPHFCNPTGGGTCIGGPD